MAWKFYDDDGTEINSDLLKKPTLCTICIHDNDSKQHSFCTLNRFSQQENDEFLCGAYISIFDEKGKDKKVSERLEF